jgi:hypothetical protein
MEKIYEGSLTKETNVEQLTLQLNAVGKKIANIVLNAERNNASKKYETEWSVALHQQSLMCRYWSVI